ncbi:hypothetical protein LAZ67_1001172 [Cordylochernes scorpioides]|uniref:Uncharacterized protein n=1 Tax=Cordylochernes scorpioides TaxID=51811 RepID=A0ABY6JW90_9ARAC|nr:hypothetical protein LAZ67_1001172 [Cordylochernes scorpioides]
MLHGGTVRLDSGRPGVSWDRAALGVNSGFVKEETVCGSRVVPVSVLYSATGRDELSTTESSERKEAESISSKPKTDLKKGFRNLQRKFLKSVTARLTVAQRVGSLGSHHGGDVWARGAGPGTGVPRSGLGDHRPADVSCVW